MSGGSKMLDMVKVAGWCLGGGALELVLAGTGQEQSCSMDWQVPQHLHCVSSSRHLVQQTPQSGFWQFLQQTQDG